MRVTTLFNRLLALPGISVADVSIGAGTVTVDVVLRARRLACPRCGFTTRAGYDRRPVSSSWRHADFGRWKVTLQAKLRRLACPEHGVVVQAVPFARHRAGFTREFEQLVAFLATKTDKTTITRLCRLDWDTVGRICSRVVADGLDPARLDGLVHIGVDEVSYKRHHYLTLITDHDGKKIVWGAEGKDAATLDAFNDRIIATVSVPAIPAAWLIQARPGAVIVTHLFRDLGGDALVRLTVDDHGAAHGHFLADHGSFMPVPPTTAPTR